MKKVQLNFYFNKFNLLKKIVKLKNSENLVDEQKKLFSENNTKNTFKNKKKNIRLLVQKVDKNFSKKKKN